MPPRTGRRKETKSGTGGRERYLVRLTGLTVTGREGWSPWATTFHLACGAKDGGALDAMGSEWASLAKANRMASDHIQGHDVDSPHNGGL